MEFDKLPWLEIGFATSVALNIGLIFLLRQAGKDQLTGLPSILEFNTKLTLFSNLAGRLGIPYSIMLFDVNDMKLLNDSLGHLAGDAAIKAIGRPLRDLRRSTEAACRIGGDELIAAILGLTPEQVRSLSLSIINEASRSEIQSGVFPSFSVGVATATNYISPEKLKTLADEQMYKAKALKADGQSHIFSTQT